MFIDWINISQVFSCQKLPIVSGGFKLDTDEYGEVLTNFQKRKWVEGSHSTAVMLRCDGSRVEFSGNIGRLGRSDNVFNLDFDSTMSKLNSLLADFGLPPFSHGEFYTDAKGNLQTTGAVITKLDATNNLDTGSPQNLAALMNYLEGQTMAYIRKGRRIGSSTLVFGSRKGRYQLEIYDKAREMLDHCKGDEERAAMKASPIYKYCLSRGIMRLELKLARQALEQNGLRFLSEVTMGKIINLFESKLEILRRGDELPASFEVEALPRKLRQTAQIYLSGGDCRIGISRATFFRQASALREYGIDIATAFKVERLPIKVRCIDYSTAVAPDWYWRNAA